MAEFSKKSLEMLRQPLETGKVTISRVQSKVTYPASFILLAAMNPCPCGYYGSNTHYCTCSPKQIQTYQNKISGPLYDRIDLLLSVKSTNLDQPLEHQATSASFRTRIEAARLRQYERYQEQICNVNVPYEKLQATSPLSGSQQQFLTQVSSKMKWSNRVYIKIIRLARTISDLEGMAEITDESLRKAIRLRSLNQYEEPLEGGR